MTVGSISASSATASVGTPPTTPPEITKAGLEAMKDRITKSGGEVPAGLDTLIQKFDDAAGRSGTMTFDQFKAFAKANGVTIPDPPKGGAAGGKPPVQGGGRAPGGGVASSTSASSSSSSTEDLSSATDAQLQALAAKGNVKALQELEKREAARQRANDEGIGQNVDAYA